MKTLYIMRHAKSDWSDASADFDRPLNKRGEKDVPRLARFLAAWETPGRLLASPARRARQTAAGMAEGLHLAGEAGPQSLLFEPSLYGADPATLSAAAAAVEDEVDSLLMVAHNPGMEDWVQQLCGARVRMPTAAIACINLNLATWRDLPDAQGQLQWFVTPKLLKALKG